MQWIIKIFVLANIILKTAVIKMKNMPKYLLDVTITLLQLVRSQWTFQVHFWSALMTNLCVNASCSPWLVVLSCQRNFKTSKGRSTLSSKIETTLIQSKRWKLIIKESIWWSWAATFTFSIQVTNLARNDEWGY